VIEPVHWHFDDVFCSVVWYVPYPCGGPLTVVEMAVVRRETGDEYQVRHRQDGGAQERVSFVSVTDALDHAEHVARQHMQVAVALDTDPT
jgi:hypothetical protein